MDGALAKVLANRDTQSSEIPDNSDSTPVADNAVSMDFGETDTHAEDEQMNESEHTNDQPEYQEDQVQPENGVEQSETQDEPEAETQSEADKRFDSLEKQRADQQSFFQHKINDLQMKLEAKVEAEKAPPAKALTDEEINELYYENPAEAMRIMQAQTQPKVNQNLAIQEGVQRAMHNDYDEVIGIVQQQATLNPALEKEIWASPDPAKAAYERGLEMKAALLIQTNPQEYEAQLRAKIEAEIKTKQPMPTRVGGVRSTAPNVGKASQSDHGQATFSKMFGKSRR